MMKMPQMKVNGKTITPNPPKMVVWRRYLAFYEQDKTHMSVEEFLDAHVGLIVLAFGRKEVTQETVDDALEISEVVPFTREIFSWLQEQIFAKLDKLPNAEAGTEEKQ